MSSIAGAPPRSSSGMQKQRLLALAQNHSCSRHELFDYLRNCRISSRQAAGLLKNYDAHASVLRRLLLKAACSMPEKAVGFILENVRNEYGNGNCENRHQLQLLSLAEAAGVTQSQMAEVKIESGVREYISSIVRFYSPPQTKQGSNQRGKKLFRPAIIAGAITATEILALEEFRAMQMAFEHHGLANHIWFDHVNVEANHTDESLALALHFIENYDCLEAVEFGMNGVLAANNALYSGLLRAMTMKSD